MNAKKSAITIILVFFYFFSFSNTKESEKLIIYSIEFNSKVDSIYIQLYVQGKFRPETLFELVAYDKAHHKIGKINSITIKTDTIYTLKTTVENFYYSLFDCFIENKNIAEIELNQSIIRPMDNAENFKAVIGFDVKPFYEDVVRYLRYKYNGSDPVKEYNRRNIAIGTRNKDWISSIPEPATNDNRLNCYIDEIGKLLQQIKNSQNELHKYYYGVAIHRKMGELENYINTNRIHNRSAEIKALFNRFREDLKREINAPSSFVDYSFDFDPKIQVQYKLFLDIIDLCSNRDQSNSNRVDSIFTDFLPLLSLNLKHGTFSPLRYFLPDSNKANKYLQLYLNNENTITLPGIMSALKLVHDDEEIETSIQSILNMQNLGFNYGQLTSKDRHKMIRNIYDALLTDSTLGVSHTKSILNQSINNGILTLDYSDTSKYNSSIDYFSLQDMLAPDRYKTWDKFAENIPKSDSPKINLLTDNLLLELLFYLNSGRISQKNANNLKDYISNEKTKAVTSYRNAIGIEKILVEDDFKKVVDRTFSTMQSMLIGQQNSGYETIFEPLFIEFQLGDSILAHQGYGDNQAYKRHKHEVLEQLLKIKDKYQLYNGINQSVKDQIQINYCLANFCCADNQYIGKCISDFRPDPNSDPISVVSDFKRELYNTLANKREDSLIRIVQRNLLTENPDLAKGLFTELPPNQKEEIVQKFVQEDGAGSAYLLQLSEDRIATKISEQLNTNIALDEKLIAEYLSHHINYLNMDVYMATGIYSFGQETNKWQALNAYFSTQLDKSKWQQSRLKSFQPFVAGNLLTYSGHGASVELGSGGRWFFGPNNKSILYGNLMVNGMYYNTDKQLIEEQEVKSFYEIEAGARLGYSYNINNLITNRFEVNISYYNSLPPADRTFVTKDVDVENIDFEYEAIKVEVAFHFWDSRVLIKVGRKFYNFPKPKEGGYNGLFSGQILLKLNK